MRSQRTFIVFPLALGILLAGTALAQLNPVLTGLAPNSAPAGTNNINLLVSGANFVAGTRVLWNNSPLPTNVLGSTQLTAQVGQPQLASPGAVQVTISNPDGRTSGSLVFTVTGSVFSIATTTLPAAVTGASYTSTLLAAGGAAPYLWTAIDPLPPDLTLSQAGVLSGVPANPGSFTFNVRVTDSQGQTATGVLTLVVTAPPFSISTPSPLPAAVVGVPYSVTFQAAGGTPPIRLSTAGALPPGLLFNASTGALTGIPSQRGNFNFNLQATDSSPRTITKAFTILVNPAPLELTTEGPLFEGIVGAFYSQNFNAAGGSTPYRWQLISGQLPPGLTFDTVLGSLSGIPTAPGSATLIVAVTDATGATARKTYSLTVELPRLTIVTTSPLPAGRVETAYSQQFTATGGSQPYSWAVIAGGVPGLVLDNASGVLSAVPATAGAFSLSVQVRDSIGATAVRVFSITISPAPLVITSTTQLPGANLNAAYLHQLEASGGVPPYVWTSNGLPQGLSLDPDTGSISGTLRAAGAIVFTVRVTDSQRVAATDLFRLNVTLPPAPELRITDLPESAAPAEQPRLNLRLMGAYSAPISGQLTLSFAPESGAGDPTIQFSTGGRTVDFTIAAQQQNAVFRVPELALQTGTVAGVITVTARLQSSGVDLTPNPPPSQQIRIQRIAPAIRSARLARTATGFNIVITGYSTPREITQAVFRFRVSPGSQLTQTEVSIPTQDLFSRWYQDTASVPFGSQFLYSQPFTIQGGDQNAVTPESVTLTNRIGSATAPVN